MYTNYVNQANDRLLHGWKPAESVEGVGRLLGVNTDHAERKFRAWAVSSQKTFRAYSELDVSFCGRLYKMALDNPPPQWGPAGEKHPTYADPAERERVAKQREREERQAWLKQLEEDRANRYVPTAEEMAEFRRRLARASTNKPQQ